MQFSVCIWSPQYTPEFAALMAAAGLKFLEPGSPFLMEQDDAAVSSSAAAFRSAGIGMYSCHGPFAGKYDLSLLDEAARRVAVTGHLEAIRRTAIASAEVMVIHPGDKCPPEQHEQRLARFYRSAEELIPVAARAGVKLALENMPPGYVGWDGAVIGRAVDHFGTPALGTIFDTGHANMITGGVMPCLQAMQGKLIAFHLHDNDGFGDKHLQPPYGSIDWGQFSAALRKMNPGFPVAIESPPWRGASLTTMVREVAAVLDGRLAEITDSAGRTCHLRCARCGRFCFVENERTFCGCEERR